MLCRLLRRFGHLSAIHPGIRKRLIWSLHGKDFDFSVPFFEWEYIGNTSNYIERFVYYMGAYEAGILEFIKHQQCRYGLRYFIDVGANVGHHSVFCSCHFEHVYAFEPYPIARARMQRMIAHNHIANVTLSDCGLSDEDAELDFFQPPENNLGMGSFVGNLPGLQKSLKSKLPLVNGSLKLAQYHVEGPSLIKIDTEGFETHVVRGLKNFLEHNPSVVIVELSEFGLSQLINDRDLVSFLEAKFLLEEIGDRFKGSVALDAVEIREVKPENYYVLTDRRLS